MSHKYPFRSTALAKQSVVESNPQAFPLREKVPTISKTTNEPRLVEDREDVIEFALSIIVLAAIVVGFLLVVELMYPGWSLSVLEVTNGY
jgi:hypothetical protein